MKSKLLAKNNLELSLEQHLIDTEQAAVAIFQGRIIKNWCHFFKVKDEEKFLKHLRIAALWHDLGKANADFYALVTGQRITQALRHEWISTFILHLPEVRQWLAGSNLDLEVITAAVLGHHLQSGRRDWGNDRTGAPNGKKVELYLDHPEVSKILTKVGQLAEVEGLPELPKQWIKGDKFWLNLRTKINEIGDDFGDEIGNDSSRRSLHLAVKAGLIAADSVASGVFRVEGSESIVSWVENNLHQQPIAPEEIEKEILEPRYQQIGIKPEDLKDFQKKAIELPSKLLLLSGCGTGKTIFAYKWQQGVLKNYQLKNCQFGRVIFLYPTRGTATEGFKDYVAWAPETEGTLLTGTAAYELQAMLENPSESTQDKDFTTDDRLYALGFWSKRFFAATVDQFLSFLTHNYKGICLLPVLADAVLVIDEVHSFSSGMFANLMSFLEHFDLPVLCMTATLPMARQKELEKFLSVYPTQEDYEQLKDLQVVEEKPRYLIQETSNPQSEAIAAFGEGKRVLWVVNTVDRCRKTAKDLEAELKTNVLTYHSRFRLQDRQQRHQEIVTAFKKGNRQTVIAVTTQVCEMSLDLDADVLITELAPISALVQRFGRSNRHGFIDHAQIWVYEPSDELPYKKAELEIARQFLKEVLGRISQKELADQLKKYSPKERRSDGESYFVNSGYWVTSESFREQENYSVNAILDGDVAKFMELKEAKDPKREGLILPVRKKDADFKPEHRPAKFPKHLGIASSQFYDEKRGFGK